MADSLLETNGAEQAYLEALAQPGGFERLTAKSYVKLDEICSDVNGLKRDVKKVKVNLETNTREDEAHRELPAHTAHKWTRETFIYVAAGMLAMFMASVAAASQITQYMPGGG